MSINRWQLALDVASPSTYQQDFGRKKEIYASMLAVREYYIYDPYQDIMPAFIGYRLAGGKYQEITFIADRLPSTVLDLELNVPEGDLRFYNPTTQQWLQPSEKRAERAETELAEALAELERLQAKS